MPGQSPGRGGYPADPMPLVAALLVVAVLLVAPAGQAPAAAEGAADPAAPAGRLPPGPLVVESAPDAPAGVVRFEPGVAHVRAAAGQSVQPELLILNGAASPLDLALAVTFVEPGHSGAPAPVDTTEGPVSTVPSAATWVSLPASSLHLDPGEQARLRPTVSVPSVAEPGGYIAAVRAGTRPGSVTGPPSRRLRRLPGDDPPGSPQLVAFLLVEVPGITDGADALVTAAVALTRRGLTGADARVRFQAEQSAVVAGRLKVSGWWGATLVDVAIPPTVVLVSVPRTQEVGFRAPILPGPYELTTSLETSAGETLSARATAWLWNPLATLIAALIVLMLAVPVVTRAALRRQP